MRKKDKNINIVKYIPYGKENAISRSELCRITGLNDRSMRDLINQARKRAVIINVQDGKGYFRPTKNDLDEVKKFKRQEENRAKEVFSCLQPIRKFIREVEMK